MTAADPQYPPASRPRHRSSGRGDESCPAPLDRRPWAAGRARRLPPRRRPGGISGRPPAFGSAWPRLAHCLVDDPVPVHVLLPTRSIQCGLDVAQGDPAAKSGAHCGAKKGTIVKNAIHPEYVVTEVTCSCGNSFTTRSTAKTGVAARRSVLGLPPVLHRQAEDHGRRRPGGQVREALRKARAHHRLATLTAPSACPDRAPRAAVF